MKRLFDIVAACIFAVVSILHMLRIVFSWDVQIGMIRVSYWISWVGMFAAAALAVWGFAMMAESRKSRTA
jgi:hypothetical protein